MPRVTHSNRRQQIVSPALEKYEKIHACIVDRGWEHKNANVAIRYLIMFVKICNEQGQKNGGPTKHADPRTPSNNTNDCTIAPPPSLQLVYPQR